MKKLTLKFNDLMQTEIYQRFFSFVCNDSVKMRCTSLGLSNTDLLEKNLLYTSDL